MMRGRLDGYASGFGTDLILTELARYQFRATFFVEALCAEHFGIEGLTAVCRELRIAGHDVQLHLHPNFQMPEWRNVSNDPPPDNIGMYTVTQQRELLERGMAILSTAGIPRSSIVAFRAGNYGASNNTWQAIAEAGLCVDSSFNLWALGKDCQFVVPGTPNDLFEPVPGVWELPVSCFAESSGYRPLQITAISAAEMRYALEHLRRGGARAATIVTHPVEFFVVDDHRRRLGRPNHVNISRLRSLLSFLNQSRDNFQLRTVGSLAAELRCCRGAGLSPASPPRGSARLRAARFPMQLVKRVLMRPRGR